MFASIIEARLREAGGFDVNLEELCKELADLNPSQGDFYPGDKVITDLRGIYNLVDPDTGNNGNKKLIIIVVSIVVLVTIIIVGVYLWFRRKRQINQGSYVSQSDIIGDTL